MEDFNADNRLLDEKIQASVSVAAASTEQQRDLEENHGVSHRGTTPATGTTKRTISVAQPIGFGFVFMVEEGLHYAVTTLGENHIFSAVMAPPNAAYKGSLLSQAEDLPALQSGSSTPDVKRICSIKSGKKYIYLILFLRCKQTKAKKKKADKVCLFLTYYVVRRRFRNSLRSTSLGGSI